MATVSGEELRGGLHLILGLGRKEPGCSAKHRDDDKADEYGISSEYVSDDYPTKQGRGSAVITLAP